MSRLSDRLARYEDETGERPWAETVAGPQPTPTHEALVDMMDRTLSLAKSAAHEGGGAATALAVALRTMQRLRPMALESLATVPVDEVRVFLRQLTNELESVIDAGEGVSDDTRPDLPAPERAGLPAGGDADGQVDPDGAPPG